MNDNFQADKLEEVKGIKVSKKTFGKDGELDICKHIPCPNCQQKLVLLPESFPMYDVQCSGCMFRAQVKTVGSPPKNQIFGAGWDIYEKVLKAGYLSPPLFINFKWEVKDGINREIRFYPFIAKGNIKKYQLSPTAKRANYRMFKYINLDKIPYFSLFQSFNPF